MEGADLKIGHYMRASDITVKVQSVRYRMSWDRGKTRWLCEGSLTPGRNEE